MAAVPAALAVLARADRVLLVRRANPPDAGLWGFPGGRIEPGERVADAAVRELHEETGIHATAGDVLTAVDVIKHDDDNRVRHHFVLIAVRCEWVDGEAHAGDDALEARWFSYDEVCRLGAAASDQVISVARLGLNGRHP